MSKRQLIVGTMILTFSGLISKLLGFIYKLLLSSSIGAINIGIYQLIFPVYIVCHTLYASGIQTALSKEIATNISHKNNNANLLYHALILSIIPAILLSIVVYASAPYIAKRLLFEPQCEAYIKMITFLFPICAVTSCINGYHYGLKDAKKPALSQLFEQSSRLLIVYVICSIGLVNRFNGCLLAVLGLIIGEIVACIFCCLTLRLKNIPSLHVNTKLLVLLLEGATFLTLNRFLINLLSTIETTLIPFMLRKYGLSSNDSLYIYGTLFGMSLPIVFFPAAISSAFSVMLLPEISNEKSLGNNQRIIHLCESVITACGVIGMFSMVGFRLFGTHLGLLIFKSSLSGTYISYLSFIAPTLYVSGTLISILNALNKTRTLFWDSLFGIIIRICSIILLVPQLGIKAYIIGLIFSQFFVCLLDFFAIKRSLHIRFNFISIILIPLLISILLLFPTKKLYILVNSFYCPSKIYSIIILIIMLSISVICYIKLITSQQRYKFMCIVGKSGSSVSN